MQYLRFVARSPNLVLQLLLILLLTCLIGGTGLVGLRTAGDTITTVSTARLPALVHLLNAQRDVEQLNYYALTTLYDSDSQHRAEVELPTIQNLSEAAWTEFKLFEAQSGNAADQAPLRSRVSAMFQQGLAMAKLAGQINRISSTAASRQILRTADAIIVTPIVQALTQLAAMEEADVGRAGNAANDLTRSAAVALLAVILLSTLVIGALQVGIGAREHVHHATVQHTADLVLFVDDQARIRFISPTFEHVFGRPGSSMLGCDVLEFIHPEDREASRHTLAQHIRNDEVVEVELRVSHADGTYRWLAATAVNQLRDPLIRGVVITCRDVTARVEAEQALRDQTLHDDLTGMPNRMLLHDRLDPGACREDAGQARACPPASRSRSLQRGQRHARPSSGGPAPQDGSHPATRRGAADRDGGPPGW